MATTLKKTPLFEKHIELGGKMVPFAGWEMPVQYSEGVLKEHQFVREFAGIFDISHMGEFELTGKDAVNFLQSLMTNDVTLLSNGKAQYACMCYPNGTVVDDLFYYQVNPEHFKIIVNASNKDKDFAWMCDHKADFDIVLEDLSESRARFAFQGPKAESILDPLTPESLESIKRFYFKNTLINWKDQQIPIFIARTGYTGEDGFEITCDDSYANALFDALLSTGAKPIGLGARDSLRLEVCYSLYGHEINDQITPIEANIGWVVKSKPSDFIGKEVLVKQKSEGTKRILVGLNLIDKGVIREHYRVFNSDEQEIGFVTSGGFAPSLKMTVGLALVAKEYSAIDTEIFVEIRGKMKKARVVKTPFLKK